jgi:two-component system invasion response regulator UvrY
VTLLRVLLVDDHPIVRHGYRRLLESTPDIRVEAEAASGEDAYARYFEIRPDVLIIDLSMPGISGIEAIKRIRAREPKAKILVFSMHDSPLMVTRALEAGATGYLSKSSAAAEMVVAVREIAQGRAFLSPGLVGDFVAARVASEDPLEGLTPREFQVFLRLAQGQGVSEIAEVLCISPKTAGVHQTNIFKKLKLRNLSELTRLAIRCGVLEP